MSKRKVRMGIDVGGTHTKAVAIDNDTFEIIGKVQVPTTHDSEQGVAAGVVECFQKCLKDDQSGGCNLSGTQYDTGDQRSAGRRRSACRYYRDRRKGAFFSSYKKPDKIGEPSSCNRKVYRNTYPLHRQTEFK